MHRKDSGQDMEVEWSNPWPRSKGEEEIFLTMGSEKNEDMIWVF